MGTRKQKMSLMEALLRRLLAKAMSGDLKALVQALNLARLYDGAGAERDPGQEAQQLELLRQLLAAGSAATPDPEPEG